MEPRRSDDKATDTYAGVNEIRLIGSRCGAFEPAISLLERKRVNPVDLITACYPLERGPDAFQRASQPGCFKVLLEMA